MALALLEKRREAIRLRRIGRPYSEIKKLLAVSKSTLSYWLRGIELTAVQRKRIDSDWVIKRIETYRETVRHRTERLEQRRLMEAKRSIGKITRRDLRIAGLFLYLGEGQKGNRWAVGISNSDPEVIRFAVRWLTNILAVPKDKIRLYIHLYKDMDYAKEFNFWSRVSGIPLSQFRKPYIKKSLLSDIDYHTHGHGTCNILFGSGLIKQTIMAEIKIVMDSLNTHP